MAKITISRLFEISQSLATKSGQELRPALQYISEFAEVTLRNLRNGLTFADNLDCQIKRVSVRSGVESVVSVANNRRATRVTVDKVVSDTYYVVSKFGWKYNSNGALVINVTLDGSPPSSLDITLDIVIHFG